MADPFPPDDSRRHRHARGSLISLVVIAALVWWFLRGISLEELASEIRRVRAPYVAGAVALSLSGFLFRILRWRYLLAPLKWMELRSLAAATFAGWAVSAILPGRVGEVARAVVLREREGVRASAVVGTIVVERLLDVLSVLVLVAATVGLVPEAAVGSGRESLLAPIRTGALVAFGALASAIAVILLMHRIPAPVSATMRRWAEHLPGPLGEAAWGMVEAFGSGVSGAVRSGGARGMSRGRVRAAVALHSAVLWGIICGVHVLLLRGFAIDASVFNVPPLLFLIVAGLSVPVPAALGSYHAAVRFGLTAMLGVSNETAAGYAVVSHAVTLGPPAIVGLIVFAHEGLTLSTLASWRAASREPVE